MGRRESSFGVKPNRPGAIVLGGNFVGLGIVRSLGARGIPTWVVDTDRSKSIAQYSRYTKRFIESSEAVETIETLLLTEGQQHQLNGWVLFPVSDDYVDALSIHHRSLSEIYRVTTPPEDVTAFALDKRLTYRTAAALGIAAPRTFVAPSDGDPTRHDLQYPLILKPAVNHRFFPHTNVKALPADSPAELRDRHAQMRAFIPAEEILVQERIPGDGEHQFSFCGLFQNGKARATLVARRRRQYPVDFGNASTFVETTTEPTVEAHGRLFLEHIGFDGIAEVEFKFDARDRQFKILDVNVRAWGWHSLGKAAGIDFPFLLWQQTIGAPLPKPETPRQAAWVREITDVVALAKSPNRGAALVHLCSCALRGRLTPATFSLRDPVPFFAELALWASHGVARQKKAELVRATAAVTHDAESL